MKKLMNAILLSCRKATGLVEKRRHCNLEKIERVKLKMHLSMCRDCSNYAKQTAVIDRLLHRTSTTFIDTSLLEDKIITQIGKITKIR